MAAGSVSLTLLSGCSDGSGPGSDSEAFTGPGNHELITNSSTDCGNGRIGAGDTVRVSGSDYVPDAAITLRWSVASEQATGTWSKVTADEDGGFTAGLKITRSMAKPGDEVTIQSEGSGQTGLMVLSTTFEMGDC